MGKPTSNTKLLVPGVILHYMAGFPAMFAGEIDGRCLQCSNSALAAALWLGGDEAAVKCTVFSALAEQCLPANYLTG